jgi:hypothetical protein
MEILYLCVTATKLQSVKVAVGLQVNAEHTPWKVLEPRFLDLPSSGSVTARLVCSAGSGMNTCSFLFPARQPEAENVLV